MVDVHQPDTLAEAVALLADLGEDATPIAGGTDVLLDRRLGRIDPRHLVDLSGLGDHLRGIDRDDDTFRIGALTRLGMLVADREVRTYLPALAEAAAGVGTPLVRNMATLGGNVCQAAPHGEMMPALLVHDTLLTMVGPDGEREVAAADLVVGPGQTALGPGDLLARVALPTRGGHGGAYVPFDPAGVGVAVGLELAGGRVERARVALCWTVPFPHRVPEAEAALEGAQELDPDVVTAVAAAVRETCDPPHDPVPGPVEFRRHVAGVMAGRAAGIAWRRATGSWPAGELSPPGGRLREETA